MVQKEGTENRVTTHNSDFIFPASFPRDILDLQPL